MVKCSIKIIVGIIIFGSIQKQTLAQSSIFGFKTGLSVGSQIAGGSGYSNSVLLSYHGSTFIETVPANPTTAILFAELGYHNRGSANRFRPSVGYDLNGNPIAIDGFTQEFIFRNVGVVLGVKQKNVLNTLNAYYAFGLRAEYTVGSNLDLPSQYAVFAYSSPVKDFVNNFNYGLTLAGGYEFPFSEFIKGFVEVSLHPDISKQYFRPAFVAYDAYTRQNVNIGEQSVRNFSIELSVGIHFLNKVEIVDGKQ